MKSGYEVIVNFRFGDFIGIECVIVGFRYA